MCKVKFIESWICRDGSLEASCLVWLDKKPQIGQTISVDGTEVYIDSNCTINSKRVSIFRGFTDSSCYDVSRDYNNSWKIKIEDKT